MDKQLSWNSSLFEINYSLKIRAEGNLATDNSLITCSIQLDCTKVGRDKGKVIKCNNLMLWHTVEDILLLPCWDLGRNVLFEPALFNSGAACAQQAVIAQGPFALGTGTSDGRPLGQRAGILTSGTIFSPWGCRGWHWAHGEHQTDRGLPNSLQL